MSLIRRGHREERGMTLVEVLVASSIMGIVLLVFTTVLSSVQRGVVAQDKLNQNLDQVNLAVQELDRELRSGNVLYDPLLENGSGAGALTSCTGCAPGYTLRVYTQTNGSNKCVLWKVAGDELMVRSWPAGVPADATSWRVSAEHLVNVDLGEYPFALDPDPLKGDRTLDLLFAVNADLANRPGQTVKIRASLTGRNTSYGYPANVCYDVPDD
ncbi:MAG: type II secretion system protein J [Candidatus Velamenicoccus archaeovorus]